MAQRPPTAAEAGNSHMTSARTTIGTVTGIFHPPEKAVESHGHRLGKRTIWGRSTPQTRSREGENRAKAVPNRKVRPSSTEQSAHQAVPQDKALESAQTQNASTVAKAMEDM